MSAEELRRRAQPLLDRAPYDALSVDELRSRARTRRRRSQRALAALTVVVVIGIGIGAVVATSGSGSNHDVKIRTTTPPAPSSTVPASTTIADLQFTPIAGPDGPKPVELFAAGDRFLAVPQAYDITRLWEGDARGHWTPVPVPRGLLHEQLQAVEHVGGRYYVIALDRAGVVVFDGTDLRRLRASRWKLLNADLPHEMQFPPPHGRGVTVGAFVVSAAVTDAGVVAVGQVSAGFDQRLLPRSVRDQLAHRPGRIDVKDGRVTVTVSPERVVYDRSTRSLGIDDDVASYLEGADASAETTEWTAVPNGPVVQESPRRDVGTPLFNGVLLPTGGGLILSSDTATSSDLWWTRDGRSWRRLASPPRPLRAIVDLGSRWVAPDAGVESDDEGRSWVPIDVGARPHHRDAPASLGAYGAPGFGILGAATPIDAQTVTTYATRLYYSPDGVRWSLVELDAALHFDANIPTIAAGSSTAVIESGRHAIGAQAQRFWLVTVRA